MNNKVKNTHLVDITEILEDLNTFIDTDKYNSLFCKETIKAINKALKNLPIIDAVKVTYCKNCKYRKQYHCPLNKNGIDLTKDNGYCDIGKEK